MVSYGRIPYIHCKLLGRVYLEWAKGCEAISYPWNPRVLGVLLQKALETNLFRAVEHYLPNASDTNFSTYVELAEGPPFEGHAMIHLSHRWPCCPVFQVECCIVVLLLRASVCQLVLT